MRFRLLPKDSPLGWTPYFWLVYLGFFLANPWFRDANRLGWAWHFAAVVVFLALYFRGYWLSGRTLLPVIGAVFVAEATSDILQVAYFKVTGGRRLFRKAPLHHHLELIGWSEPQVVMRLYLVGIAAAMVGVALALSV